ADVGGVEPRVALRRRERVLVEVDRGHVRGAAPRGGEREAARVRHAVEDAAAARERGHERSVVALVEEEARLVAARGREEIADAALDALEGPDAGRGREPDPLGGGRAVVGARDHARRAHLLAEHALELLEPALPAEAVEGDGGEVAVAVDDEA